MIQLHASEMSIPGRSILHPIWVPASCGAELPGVSSSWLPRRRGLLVLTLAKSWKLRNAGTFNLMLPKGLNISGGDFYRMMELARRYVYKCTSIGDSPPFTKDFDVQHSGPRPFERGSQKDHQVSSREMLGGPSIGGAPTGIDCVHCSVGSLCRTTESEELGGESTSSNQHPGGGRKGKSHRHSHIAVVRSTCPQKVCVQ